MSWYYTREPGPSGEVLTDEGTPDGMLLSEVLKQGPLPLRAGLELVAAMADILTIAEEDDALHGDLKPGVVRVNAQGAVSVEDYGVTRRGSRAPEGSLQGVATDTYGLGVVLHALLSSTSLGAVPRERDAHDDHIVGKLLGIDWGELAGKKWNDPVMHFLCSMLAHDPAERPHPLDVANILGEVGQQVPGDDLVAWAESIVERPQRTRPPRPQPSVSGEEDLSGPQSLGRAVSQTGAFSRRKAGRAKGECTAFWSREKISEMLDDGPAAASSAPRPRAGRRDMPTPPVVPPVSPQGGSTPRILDAYPKGTPDLPDATITGQAADEELQKVIAQYKASLDTEDAGSDQGAPGVRPPAGMPPLDESSISAALPPPAPAPPPASAPPPVAARPIVSQGRAGGTPPIAPTQAKPERTIPWLAISLGVGGLAIAIALVVLAAVLYQMKSPEADNAYVGGSTVDSAVTQAMKEAKANRTPKAKKIRSKDRSSRKERRERRERRERKARQQKAKKAQAKSASTGANATGTFVVKFKSPDARTRLECGDGQKVAFLGTTRVTFQSVTTCRVVVGDAQGTVLVREPSQYICGAKGNRAFCKKR